MGNYYEGELTFRVNNKIPADILNEFIKYHSSEKPLKPFGNIAAVRVWYYHNDLDCDILTTKINDPTKYPEFFIEFSICSKHYTKEQTEKELVFIRDKLKPYKILNDDIEDLSPDLLLSMEYIELSKNYIGEVKDEDHTYHKIFLWDDTVLDNVIASRKYLCNGCKFSNVPNTNTAICDRYIVCKRAYDLGSNTILKLQRLQMGK